MKWMQKNLFKDPLNSCLSLLLGLVFFKMLLFFVDWAVLNSTWTGTAQECRDRSGACWSFIREKAQFILFGYYPGEEQWRACVLIFAFLFLFIISQFKRFWGKALLLSWITLPLLSFLLMRGGFLGLRPVEMEQFGGLPLTLILSLLGIGAAYPLGILLALGRRSSMPLVRLLSTVYIEFIRGIPLISILFMASLMFPLFLPEGMSIDKVVRAQAAIIFFSSAYMAEVVRGGLQAIPKGQYEAAWALGLSYPPGHGPRDPAPGPQNRDSPHGQHFYQPFQGYFPGLYHFPVRSHVYNETLFHGQSLARVYRGGLCFRRLHLFCLLLFYGTGRSQNRKRTGPLKKELHGYQDRR